MPKAPKVTKENLLPTLSLLALLSLFLWSYTFRYFLFGSAALEGDAYPYLGHIRFYLENIVQGVYPLWNPFSENGNVNEFFLRRIGEFNPFYFFIVLLNKSGFTFAIAHRLFLGAYFLLGVAGFYLLGLRIFRDRTVALTAALLLLFSSWGGKVFESFIVLELVPFLWFAYFVTAFVQTPSRLFLLGATFSLMIINITYIPFYFYTIFFIFVFVFLIIYRSQIFEMMRPAQNFIAKDKIFTGICCVLLVCSLVPGFLWYKAARQGEGLSAPRHVGAQSSDTNTATVGISKINEGGILPYYIIDRQFVNLDKLRLDDFYLPFFIFLMFIAGLWTPLNRKFVLFFTFGLAMFLIGLADASGIHAALYKYIPFFKYFRNLQFFLWLAVLPVSILFVAGQIHSFLQQRSKNLWTIGWIITAHAAAVLFCLLLGTKGFSTYLVILFSLAWMLLMIFSGKNKKLGLWLLWAAVVIQPFDVLGHLAEHYPPVAAERFPYDNTYALSLPTPKEAEKILSLQKLPSIDGMYIPAQPYFAISWYYEALGQIEYPILHRFISAPFLLYDSVRSTGKDKIDYALLSKSMAGFKNVAFIHTDRPLVMDAQGSPQAKIITAGDPTFEILKLNVNSLTVKTSFPTDQFLVWSQNYHSQWRAYIDDKQKPLFRTNILTRGLHVPPGQHIIRFEFEQTRRYILAYFFIALYAAILGNILWLAYHSKKYV